MHIRAKIRPSAGFTIVELIIVIIVIAILATLVTVGYGAYRTHTRETAVKSDLRNAAAQLESDRNFTNAYPASIAAANGGKGLRASEGTVFTYATSNGAYCLSATSTLDGVGVFHIASSGTQIEDGPCPDQGGGVPTNPTDPNDQPPSSVIANCLPGAPTPAGYTVYDATGKSSITISGYTNYIVQNVDSVNSINFSGSGKLIFCGQDMTQPVTYIGLGIGQALVMTGSGNDSITSSGAYATIVSGDGDDTISVSGAGVTVYAGAGNDNVTFSGSITQIYGGSGDDTISGNGAMATIWGGLGNDTIHATGGGTVVHDD